MFPSPLGASYFQISPTDKYVDVTSIKWFPSPLGASYFQIKEEKFRSKLIGKCFRPLRASYFKSKMKKTYFEKNVLITFPSPLRASYFKYCPPEPAILLAFLTLLRGKSFSCIFFLISNIHNRLQMQYLCRCAENYKLYQYYLNSNFTF